MLLRRGVGLGRLVGDDVALGVAVGVITFTAGAGKSAIGPAGPVTGGLPQPESKIASRNKDKNFSNVVVFIIS